MQIHSDHPPEQFEEMTGTGIWMHSGFCVCVFLLILADVMKSISSPAAGHHSGTNRGECGWEKYFSPSRSCVTLAVGHGGWCVSTTRVFFFCPCSDVCAADSADCWDFLCPVKSRLCSPLSMLHPLPPKHVWRMLQMNSFSLGVVWSKCYSGSTGSYIRGFLFCCSALSHSRLCCCTEYHHKAGSRHEATGQNCCIIVRFSITAQPRV